MHEIKQKVIKFVSLVKMAEKLSPEDECIQLIDFPPFLQG